MSDKMGLGKSDNIMIRREERMGDEEEKGWRRSERNKREESGTRNEKRGDGWMCHLGG